MKTMEFGLLKNVLIESGFNSKKARRLLYKDNKNEYLKQPPIKCSKCGSDRIEILKYYRYCKIKAWHQDERINKIYCLHCLKCLKEYEIKKRSIPASLKIYTKYYQSYIDKCIKPLINKYHRLKYRLNKTARIKSIRNKKRKPIEEEIGEIRTKLSRLIENGKSMRVNKLYVLNKTKEGKLIIRKHLSEFKPLPGQKPVNIINQIFSLKNNRRVFTANAVLEFKRQGSCQHRHFRIVYSSDFVIKTCAGCGKELEDLTAGRNREAHPCLLYIMPRDISLLAINY